MSDRCYTVWDIPKPHEAKATEILRQPPTDDDGEGFVRYEVEEMRAGGDREARLLAEQGVPFWMHYSAGVEFGPGLVAFTGHGDVIETPADGDGHPIARLALTEDGMVEPSAEDLASAAAYFTARRLIIDTVSLESSS